MPALLTVLLLGVTGSSVASTHGRGTAVSKRAKAAMHTKAKKVKAKARRRVRKPTPPKPAPAAQPAVVAAPVLPAPTVTAPTVAAPASTPTNRTRFWGAWIGKQLTGAEAPWDTTAIDRFEQLAGKRISLLNFSSPFFNCSQTACTPNNFPLTPFNTLRARGIVPFFSWNSAGSPVQVNDSRFRLSTVAAGTYDNYVDSWATAAAKWGHPFFLRLNWEMNGNWFPWAATANGNTPADYIAAWRHIHDRFVRAGASNATFVWCPNVDPDHRYGDLARLYPGDAYVDWTCLDGYPSQDSRVDTFERLFRATYDDVTTRIAPGKPMVIGETATTEDGNKAAWIAGMFRSLQTMPSVRGLLWFDKLDAARPNDVWPIESSAASQAAFAAGIAAPEFSTNRFAALAQSPILAP